MTQKVFKIGDSAGITLSKELLRILNISIGQQVSVEHDEKRGGIVVLPLREEKNEVEFSNWTKEFLKQYGPALKSLASK